MLPGLSRRDAASRAIALLCAACVAIGPVAARAAETPPTERKLAVLDVAARGKVEPKEVEGLSSLIASEVASLGGFDVISGSDIRSMVGYEKQRQLLGCSDAGCLAEIGGALGADYIVGSEVSEVGGHFLLSLSLVDIKKTKVVSRLTRTTRTTAELVPLTQSAVRELLSVLETREAAPAPAVAAAPAPAPAVSGGRSKIPGLLLIGLGVVAAGYGGLLLLDAAKKRQTYIDGTDEDDPTRTYAEAKELRELGERNANLGYVGVGAGLALAIFGIVLLPSGAPAPTVSAAPLPGGGVVSATVPLR